MFNEYLKPVRSFKVHTNYDPQEIDTHGLLALAKADVAPVCIKAPGDNRYQNFFFLSPGEFFRFNGKINVTNDGESFGVLQIMLFDKE